MGSLKVINEQGDKNGHAIKSTQINVIPDKNEKHTLSGQSKFIYLKFKSISI